jgi:hypothetical protein
VSRESAEEALDEFTALDAEVLGDFIQDRCERASRRGFSHACGSVGRVMIVVIR